MAKAPPSRRKIPYARPIALVAALFVAYLLLGFLAGPPLVKRILTHELAETLKRKVSVGEVRVNPLALTLELKDLALAEADGAPIAGLRRLFADFQLSSLTRRAWTFSEITLEGLELRADIAPGGRFNLLALLEDLPKSESKPGDRPPRVLLQRAQLTGGALSFSDRSLAEPASAQLAPLNLEVHDLSTIPDAEGNYAVSVRLPGGGTVAWKGAVSLQPLASRGELRIKGLKPATTWSFIGRRYAFLDEPKGEFDLGAGYRFAYGAGSVQLTLEDLNVAGRGIVVATSGEQNVALALASLAIAGARAEFSTKQGRPWQAKLAAPKIAAGELEFADRSRVTPYRAQIKALSAGFTAAAEDGAQGGQGARSAQAKLENLAVAITQLSAGEAAAAQPIGTLESIALEGGSIDLAERTLAVGRLAVTGGALRVERDQDGKLPLLGLLARSDAGVLRRELSGVAREATAEGRPWRASLAELTVEGIRVAYSDRSFGAEPVAYDVRDLKLSAQGIDTEDKAPLKFEAALGLAQGGRISASGDARISGEQANLRARLERVSLKPLQPAVATRANVVLAAGEASADVKAAYRQAAGKHALKLSGTARVDDLLFNEKDSGERLLAWKSLSASGLSFGLAPDQLLVEEAQLRGVDAKIVVFKDRSTNLSRARLLQKADQAANQPAVTTADTEALFPVTVRRVRLEGGAVDFADLSLVLPFGAKVHKLTGLVEGASTDRKSRATLRLEGVVDEYGLARAEGGVAPFDPTRYTDISVIFRNVDMPPLSSYSATFAGRRIASGKLSLDLKYKIDEGRLAGENRMLLEKFTLGEKVQSEGALDLPLDLAVALLTDADGRIDLAVPVTGDLNDPQFGYGHIVWQAIRTVIGKIVSAPFRALASIFGGGSSETLDSISFDPGRSALLPPEQEKLKRVADGLAQRPQIRIVVEGQTGPADRAALRQREVAFAVGAKLGRTPAQSADPDPVNVTDAKTQRALEALFIERNSEEALAKFIADTGTARGKEVARVSAVLALLGRASEDGAFYEALLKRLNETAPVADDALAKLADSRAHAVTAHLAGKLGLPADRAGVRPPKAAEAPQVKLDLEAAAK